MENEKTENMANYETEQNISIAEYQQPAFTSTRVEESVIKAAQQGNKKAFENLFIGTYRYVFAAVRKYLKNDQDIYDAIQESYIKVYKGIPRLESVSSFYPWLHKICENCAKDVLRYSNSEVFLSSDEDIEKIPVQDKTEEANVSADINEALKQIPQEQAELLILVYYDKMRVAEIARLKGIPVTTVHNRLKTAKKILKEFLKIRGIDKPIYSGELVSMVSAALRDAIGTNLLSMAVAQEILHSVTGSNKKETVVLSVFAKKMQRNAVKKIAGILLFSCVLITVLSFLAVSIISNNFHKNGDLKNTSTGAGFEASTSSDSNLSSPDSTTSKQESTLQGTASTSSSSKKGNPNFDFYISTMEEPVELLGSFKDTETFGTQVDNEELDIAISGNKVYAVVNGNLVCLVSGQSSADVLIKNFSELYGKDGKCLNVFGGKVYWVNKNNENKFVLNRCEINGADHCSVVFTDPTLSLQTEYKFLNKMIVAKDGIYFCVGVYNGDGNFALLYRTDYDFNIEKSSTGISDYTIIKDKIYYISGSGNAGHPFHMDRATFWNSVDITADWIAYDNIYSFGEYIVLDSHSLYADPYYSACTDFIVMDTVSGKIVRAIYGEKKYVIDIKDVSDINGGTVLLQYDDKSMTMNIKTGELKVVSNHKGAISGSQQYYIESGSLYASNIDGSSPKKIY